MSRISIEEQLRSGKMLYFDGGTGSILQENGLQPGELPERWNLSHADFIRGLHENYYKAGANIIKTDTFGLNCLKFAEDELKQIVNAALANANAAREAIENSDHTFAKAPHYIALDIGPTGKLLKPLGDLAFEDAVDVFKSILKPAATCGGFDLVLIETMNDVYEAKAAVLAAKETTDVPIFVTTVYDENAKLLTGADPETCVALFEGLGVTAVGLNCSLGPKQMAPIVPRLVAASSIPVIVNPNAGLPRSENGKTVYDVDPDDFAECMAEIAKAGANIIGGCCGTTPAHIARMVELTKDIPAVYPEPKNLTVITSYTHAVYFKDRPILIGERINPTGKKRFKQALRDHDIDYILQEGLTQQDNHADVLDVNVGLPEIDEPSLICDVITELQGVLDLPLQIDTTDPIALERGLRLYNGKALINSVNGKQEVMDTVFPLVKKYGGVVVALLIDEDGIPETCEGRLKIAEKLYAEAEKYGLKKSDLLIDSLCMSVASDDVAGRETLKTVDAITRNYHGKTILGVSNISFGLPHREIVTAAFFQMAMQAGLSAAIINPNSIDIQKAYACHCMLSGFDEKCLDYITFATENEDRLTAGTAPATAGAAASAGVAKPGAASDTLEYFITKGLAEPAAEKTKAMIGEGVDPMVIINDHLINALNIVGKKFEEKTLFLPQLLMSAGACSAAFDVIKTHMINSGTQQQKKCKIILATVKGDIHDIGKNIVKTLLENYGFDVIDLGKDVPPETVVESCIEHHAPLVGLSALMTTTVPSMEATIKLLREKAPWAKAVVGGAVLTQEYADMIGADKYCKDAMETVGYATEVHEAWIKENS